jgi:hypothetical protein
MSFLRIYQDGKAGHTTHSGQSLAPLPVGACYAFSGMFGARLRVDATVRRAYEWACRKELFLFQYLCPRYVRLVDGKRFVTGLFDKDAKRVQLRVYSREEEQHDQWMVLHF